MKKLIAYCGLDCEKCDARIATVNNDDALREKTAKLWSEMNHADITADMIHCMGCRVKGVKTPFCDGLCPIRQCALKRDVGTCADCPEMERCETLAMVTANDPEALLNLRALQEEQAAMDVSTMTVTGIL